MVKSTQKHNHFELGKHGEELACQFLMEKGYRILARNWREGALEVDIIAATNQEVVFVEVKTRSTHFFGNPEESVNFKKQQNLMDAAEFWSDTTQYEGEIRFDIIAVVMNDNKIEIEHFEDAFYFDEE